MPRPRRAGFTHTPWIWQAARDTAPISALNSTCPSSIQASDCPARTSSETRARYPAPPSTRSGLTPTSSVNMATAAGMRISSSTGRTGRTRGSGATAGGPSMAMSGCRGRWLRHGPQEGASSSHSGSTEAAGPTMVEHRRPARRARSAKAAAAARSAPGAANGIRFAPARHTASSSGPRPIPHSGAPSDAADVPAISMRPASTHAATGSVASSRVTAGSSASSRTRAVGVLSTAARSAQERSGNGDDGRPRGHALVDLLPGQPHGLLDERLHDLRLRHGLDDLALDEDLPLAVARGDAQVGLAGLARAVDDAAHDGHPQRDLEPVETGGHLVGELVDVDLGAPARGAADDLQTALAQVQRLEDLVADLDLLHRRGGEGDADRVADALAQQRAEGDGGLDRALEGRPGLGHPEVQRVVALLGEQLVGPDHDHRVVVLDRDLDVAEVVLLEQGGLPQRGLDQRLRGGLAVLGQQPLVQRAGVDADADRRPVVLGRLRDVGDPVVELLDVAGVHADRGAAGLDRGEDVPRLEVDVGDHRDLRVPRDLRQRLGVVGVGDGDPHDLATGRGELGDLLQRRVHVGGLGGAHRLEAAREVAADADAADVELTRLPPGREDGRGRSGHAETHRDRHDPQYPPWTHGDGGTACGTAGYSLIGLTMSAITSRPDMTRNTPATT